MKRALAASLVTIVIAHPGFVSAGSEPDATSQSATDERANLTRQLAQELQVGSMVSVRLVENGRVTGILMSAGDDAVVVQPKGRVPEPPRRIPYDQIALLEPQTGGMSAGKAIAIGVAAGAASFVGLILIMLASFAD